MHFVEWVNRVNHQPTAVSYGKLSLFRADGDYECHRQNVFCLWRKDVGCFVLRLFYMPSLLLALGLLHFGVSWIFQYVSEMLTCRRENQPVQRPASKIWQLLCNQRLKWREKAKKKSSPLPSFWHIIHFGGGKCFPFPCGRFRWGVIEMALHLCRWLRPQKPYFLFPLAPST